VAHNLAQLVHAVAQGKIGSGFDVAAAVYGECLLYCGMCRMRALALYEGLNVLSQLCTPSYECELLRRCCHVTRCVRDQYYRHADVSTLLRPRLRARDGARLPARAHLQVRRLCVTVVAAVLCALHAYV
jgi:uncharacterized protein YuzB (UPF0349 family)